MYSIKYIRTCQITTIPWKQIYGMRNRIVHGYEGVEMRIVWDAIKTDLPLLKNEVFHFLQPVFLS